MKQTKLKVIISGGGTGGHVFPAIAIANAIKKIRPDTEILFVGAKGRLEMEKVPKAGFPIQGLWISGIDRKFSVRNLLFPFKVLSSLLKSWNIIRQFQPQVVVGVGGFASGPLLQVANMLGIPSLIQEQNSYAGITNKLLARKAEKICVAYQKMERFFPKDKIVLTGNPVREDLKTRIDSNQAFLHFGLDPNKKTIFVFGGSLGARTINQAMAKSQPLIDQHQEQIQILWQAGKLYIEEFKNSDTAQLPNVKILQFIDRMDLAYSMADVVICRAGALTIAELSLLGKAAILIPSPNVAEDHQSKNASAIVDIGGGIMIQDKEAGAQMISSALELLNDEHQRKQMSEQILAMASPDAANKIAKEVIQLGNHGQ